VAPTSIPSGGAGTGTVTLTKTSSQTATVVDLSADQPFIEVPATVTVPAGATTATFPVKVGAISGGDTATLTASEPGSSVFTGVMAGFNGTAPSSWSTYAGDEQNSGRSFSNNQTGTLGWSRSDLSGNSLLYGPDGTLFVVTPPATGGTTFKITAVNPATGKSYWSELWPASSAQPQVVLDYGGSLLVPTTDGIAFVNPANGATKYVLDPSDGTMTYLSVLAGPANRIYVVAQSWTGTYVAAINIATDTFVWVQEVGQGTAPTLGLAADYDDTIYVAACRLYAFVGATGKIRWSATSPITAGEFGGTPVVGHGGVVYAESVSARPALTQGDLAAYSTATGALNWHIPNVDYDATQVAQPVLGWQGQILTAFGSFQGSPSNPIVLNLDYHQANLVQLNGDWIGETFDFFVGAGQDDSELIVGNLGFNGTNLLWQQVESTDTAVVATGVAMAPDGTIFISGNGLLFQLKP
jgi:PQQ-like domain